MMRSVSACLFVVLAGPSVAIAEKPAEEAKGRDPQVIKGLEISPKGGLTIEVSLGECTVGGKNVSVTSAARFELEPVTIHRVEGEQHKLVTDKPWKWAKGTPLEQCKGLGTTLPGCPVPGSVVVRPGPGGEPYLKEKDYLVDETWGMLGRVEGGRIGADTVVYIDYAWSAMRIDTVQVSPAGKVSVRKGVEAKMCPHPAGAEERCLALANIFLDYNVRELTPEAVFPIGEPLSPPTQEELAKKASRVAKVRKKLQDGGEVRIGFWGDSVTCGGDASKPEFRFPEGFIIDLRRKYPNARIESFNAGIGGSSTQGRLPGFDQDVIQKKPDLVIVEFVNDMGYPPQLMRDNYYKAIDQVQAIGGEVILITPHFTMPEMMGFAGQWGKDSRAACQALREIAEEKQVGLADAARVWQHLCKAGIPYITYLYNGINHPDDRGHRIFIDELMKFF